jgi:hypothetical protein
MSVSGLSSRPENSPFCIVIISICFVVLIENLLVAGNPFSLLSNLQTRKNNIFIQDTLLLTSKPIYTHREASDRDTTSHINDMVSYIYRSPIKRSFTCSSYSMISTCLRGVYCRGRGGESQHSVD